MAQFSKQTSKALKQWKDGLSPTIWAVFMKTFADELTRLIIDGLPKMSLLGALYFENVVAKLKKYF